MSREGSWYGYTCRCEIGVAHLSTKPPPHRFFAERHLATSR